MCACVCLCVCGVCMCVGGWGTAVFLFHDLGDEKNCVSFSYLHV